MRYLLIAIDTEDEDFDDYMVGSLIEAIDQSECGFVQDSDFKPYFPPTAG